MSYFYEGVTPHLKSFTYFRLLDQRHPQAQELSRRIKGHRDKIKAKVTVDEAEDLVFTAALAHDAFLALTQTVAALNFVPAWRSSINISCSAETPWEYGTTFLNYLNAIEVNGITGQFSFEVTKFHISERYLQRAKRLCMQSQISLFVL